MANGVTTGEFERGLGALQSEMRAGFQGLNARLDRVNGRLERHDDAIQELRPTVAEQGVKISTLNREVFREGGRRLIEHTHHDGDRPHGRVNISLPTDAKTIAAIFVTAGGLIAAAVLAWMKGPGGSPP